MHWPSRVYESDVRTSFMNLRSVDLNLLTIFDAIYVEKNVSQAARRLSMSQSAASSALNRLRTLFDDELFVRSNVGVIATSKANMLAAPINEILQKVELTLYTDRDVDFSKVKYKFSLAMSDYSEQIILPALMTWIEKKSPNIQISVVPLDEQTLGENCADGKVDLAIGYLPYLENGFYCQNLIKDSFVSVARIGNPILQQPWTLEAFLNQPHVSVNFRGSKGTAIDSALDLKKLKRHCILRVPNFRSIPAIVSTTDFVGDMPLHLVKRMHEREFLKILTPPFDIAMTEINQFWHERVNRSPVHQWFRQNLYEISTSLLPK